jgi:GTP-binding protein EngB required for normal cell division
MHDQTCSRKWQCKFRHTLDSDDENSIADSQSITESQSFSRDERQPNSTKFKRVAFQEDSPLNFVIERPPVMIKSRRQIKIVIVGETGAGKSTLINFIFTWAKKFTVKDFINRRKIAIKSLYYDGDGSTEADPSDQSQSQTQFCKLYNYELEIEGQDFIYDIVLMDTPGFGDVRGIEQDDKNEDEIIKSIKDAEKINAVLIVLNGSAARITHRTICLMSKLMNLLPDTFAENVYFLQTNVNKRPALDLSKCLQLQDINFAPKKENIFFIQNDAFTLDDEDFKDEIVQEQLQVTLKKCKQSLTNLFKLMESSALKDVDAFGDLKKLRDEMKLKLRTLVDLEVQAENESAELSKAAQMIAGAKDSIEALRSLKFDDVIYHEVIPTDNHNTICVHCKHACHLNCALDEIKDQGSEKIRGCIAFGKVTNELTCTECQHSYEYHVHLKVVYKAHNKKNTLIEENLKKIGELKEEYDRKEMLKTEIDKRIEDLNKKTEDLNKQTIELMADLKKVCGRFNYYTEVRSTVSMIEDHIQSYRAKYEASKSQADLINIHIYEGMRTKFNRILKFLISENSSQAV